MTTTAQEAIEKIQAAALQATRKLRQLPTHLEIGQVIHQGDVYLHRVPDDWPRGKELGTRQVAIGTNIGARHVVEGEYVAVYEGKQYPEGFEEPEDCQPGALLGPVVVSPEVLTHPEHAHHAHPTMERQTFQVTYQFDPRTMRAVQD